MDVDKTQQFLLETEAAAQEVLITREEMVALDYRRQKSREAFRAIKTSLYPQEKMWLSFGNVFVKTRTSKAQTLIERGKMTNARR